MHHGLKGSAHGELAAALPLVGAVPGARPERAVPTSQSERIPALDILRGLALLGMFLVHFNMYEATPVGAEPGPIAAFLERFIGLFVEERFYGIFGILFGVGFAVQLERATARGSTFVSRYLRRLAMVAVFGFIAEGVFGYNVLIGYAMWGVPLLLVNRLPLKALVVLLVLCTAARPIVSTTRLAIANTRPGGEQQFTEQEQKRWTAFRAGRDSTHAAEQSKSWGTVVAARVKFMPRFHKQWNVLPNGTFILLLMGLIAWRLGLLRKPGEHRRTIIALTIFGAASTLLATFVLPIGGPPAGDGPPPGNPVWNAFVLYARYGFQLMRHQWLTFSYMGVILLLVARGPHWVRRLSPLGWVGQMALTNYMMQVVLLDTLFTPHGFGMKIPALLVFPAAIALFVGQVFFSRWWLARFNQGPLEWVLRSVTNWNTPPLRRDTPVTVRALAA
jgi:uncharacterized protein